MIMQLHRVTWAYRKKFCHFFDIHCRARMTRRALHGKFEVHVKDWTDKCSEDVRSIQAQKLLMFRDNFCAFHCRHVFEGEEGEAEILNTMTSDDFDRRNNGTVLKKTAPEPATTSAEVVMQEDNDENVFVVAKTKSAIATSGQRSEEFARLNASGIRLSSNMPVRTLGSTTTMGTLGMSGTKTPKRREPPDSPEKCGTKKKKMLSIVEQSKTHRHRRTEEVVTASGFDGRGMHERHLPDAYSSGGDSTSSRSSSRGQPRQHLPLPLDRFGVENCHRGSHHQQREHQQQPRQQQPFSLHQQRVNAH
jgi:hypothetical protein